MDSADQNPTPPKLTLDLVPRSTWEWNVRSELTKTQWDKLRKQVYEKAGHRCEICGGVGSRHPVEAHEKWVYDDNTHVQTLVGIEALCPMCHKTRHFGLSIQLGVAAACEHHMMKVNGWSINQVIDHINQAFKVWQERSKYAWHLDLSWLKNGVV